MPASDGSPFSAVPYASFTNFTPVLPAFYYDVYSSEQRIKAICMEIDKLINYADALNVNLNITHEDVAELKAEFEKFKESGFNDYYKKQVADWIASNLEYVFTRYTRGVYFGLNQEGYFVAYIPESWDDVEFDTGSVYGSETYGRLVLRMDVDSPYKI